MEEGLSPDEYEVYSMLLKLPLLLTATQARDLAVRFGVLDAAVDYYYENLNDFTFEAEPLELSPILLNNMNETIRRTCSSSSPIDIPTSSNTPFSVESSDSAKYSPRKDQKTFSFKTSYNVPLEGTAPGVAVPSATTPEIIAHVEPTPKSNERSTPHLVVPSPDEGKRKRLKKSWYCKIKSALHR